MSILSQPKPSGSIAAGRFAALAVAILLAAGQAGQEPRRPFIPRMVPDAVSGPCPLRAEPEALDFGFVRPGQDRTGQITLTNDSPEPVTIAAIQPTCTCTTTTKP